MRRVSLGKNQRRAQLDDVVVRAVAPRQNSMLAQSIHDVRGLLRRRLPRLLR